MRNFRIIFTPLFSEISFHKNLSEEQVFWLHKVLLETCFHGYWPFSLSKSAIMKQEYMMLKQRSVQPEYQNKYWHGWVTTSLQKIVPP